MELELFTKVNNISIISLSGGLDSMALLHLFRLSGFSVQAAHCNFNLRGEESDKDERFVKELANKHGVKYKIKSFETQKYAFKHNTSIQMAARELRYKWFDELLANNNLDFVITAHHKDDNIETFFINLIRGAGINGLSAIKARNNKVIRPLLDISKKEIECYLIQKRMFLTLKI